MTDGMSLLTSEFLMTQIKPHDHHWGDSIVSLANDVAQWMRRHRYLLAKEHHDHIVDDILRSQSFDETDKTTFDNGFWCVFRSLLNRLVDVAKGAEEKVAWCAIGVRVQRRLQMCSLDANSLHYWFHCSTRVGVLPDNSPNQRWPCIELAQWLGERRATPPFEFLTTTDIMLNVLEQDVPLLLIGGGTFTSTDYLSTCTIDCRHLVECLKDDRTNWEHWYLEASRNRSDLSRRSVMEQLDAYITDKLNNKIWSGDTVSITAPHCEEGRGLSHSAIRSAIFPESATYSALPLVKYLMLMTCVHHSWTRLISVPTQGAITAFTRPGGLVLCQDGIDTVDHLTQADFTQLGVAMQIGMSPLQSLRSNAEGKMQGHLKATTDMVHVLEHNFKNLAHEMGDTLDRTKDTLIQMFTTEKTLSDAARDVFNVLTPVSNDIRAKLRLHRKALNALQHCTSVESNRFVELRSLVAELQEDVGNLAECELHVTGIEVVRVSESVPAEIRFILLEFINNVIKYADRNRHRVKVMKWTFTRNEPRFIEMVAQNACSEVKAAVLTNWIYDDDEPTGLVMCHMLAERMGGRFEIRPSKREACFAVRVLLREGV